MKVLVTGGSGYLGSVLVPKLLNRGYEVSVLDNLLYQQQTLIDLCSNSKFRFIYGDVRDGELFHKEMIKADVIIHLAAYVGMPACKKYPHEATQVNFGSVEFLSVRASDNQLIIFPNTNSGYGTDLKPGEGGTFFDETSELHPISLYGETKCKSEKILLENNNAISLRLATVFGVSPRMRLDLLVNDFTYRAVHDKFIVLFESHFKRNFIHIQDVTDTFLFCIDNHQKMTGQAYNVGLSSANISKRELCEVIKKHVPGFCIVESDINSDPDKRNYIVSNKKLESLGWKCNYDLDMGIDELIKAYSIILNVHTAFTNI